MPTRSRLVGMAALLGLVAITSSVSAQVTEDGAAVAAALSLLRGDVAAVPLGSIRLVYVDSDVGTWGSPAKRHVARWTSQRIVTVYGYDDDADAAAYAATLLLDERAQVCSVTIYRSGEGRVPEITREYMDRAVLALKGLDRFFAAFAEEWIFRDLTWGFETTDRAALVAFARAAAPDGLVGMQEDTVLWLGRDGVAIEGHVELSGGRRNPFLVVLRFDEQGRIARRFDHFDLTEMTFPTLQKAGLDAVLRGMRCG